jgi:predicted esterase
LFIIEMAYLPAVEIKSAATPQATIIWLHGMGADGRLPWHT